jgi:membrane protein DedA with SNARE-associated domain/rhodanese-related sulfurtransferase
MRELIILLIAHGAVIVFLVTLAARAGAPFPAAPIIVVAGGLAVAGQVSPLACLLASVVANVLGDAIWFQAGRWRGHRVMKLLCQISLSPDTCVRQSEDILTKWGGSSLIAAKFLPGISVMAAPMAGALRMSWMRFVAYDTGAALIWTLVFLAVGMIFSNGVVVILNVMAQFGLVAAIVIAVGVAGMLLFRYLRRQWMISERYAPRVSVHELRDLMIKGTPPIVIDLRSKLSIQADSRIIPGAVNSTLDDLSLTAHELPRDRQVVLYCNCPNEVTALQGVRILAKRGHVRARALHGGLAAWLELEFSSPSPAAAIPS